ncbi:MAG: hypothetical protein ACD_76C00085G0008 [uncultured bacterium]|nr:MAG: hypothetical protein ACD_76C00085G0008 [uncultured bacterium]HBD05535.1 hypothetical protein [Candidatus Uhrbacteria bacterium]
MDANISKQIFSTICRAKRPLILVPPGANIDGLATSIGLKSVLKSIGIESDIVSQANIPKGMKFISGHEEILNNFPNMRKMIVELDITKTKLDELSYNIENGKLCIHIQPKIGSWKREDILARHGSFRYDVIICLGAKDLHSFGQMFHDHADFFYKTPIINIDHSTSNEHFGHYNAVDVTATAISEIVHAMIEEHDHALISEHVATCLLAGMIAKTKSFRTQNVTPKTLRTASKLMHAGADREKIVQELFRTRTVETLRLWGRALARLKSDKQTGLVWTVLSRQDFVLAGAQEEDIGDVIDELIVNSPETNVALLIYEDTDGTIRGVLHAQKPNDATELASKFRPTGNRDKALLHFRENSLPMAEQTIVPHLREKLAMKNI